LAESVNSGTRSGLIEELRKVKVFSELEPDQLARLAERFEEVHFQAGAIYARPGDPVEYLNVILEGEIRMQRGTGSEGSIYVAFAGQVTGVLPYSRLTHSSGTARAFAPTRILRLHRKFFPEMLQRIPQLGQRLVAIMADRIRETTRIDTQLEKLSALGKLSSGLAHELNNPAAAAQRATASLREALVTVRDASIRLARLALSAERRELIVRFEGEAMEAPTVPADPLVESDREERITAWLEGRHLSDA